MYLTRLYIRGFKSIKELDLPFLPGKNVIIGRNNSGKSNIVKALDIILGENAPAYAKAENITETDFYTEERKNELGEITTTSANEIFIWCELRREAAEELDWTEIDRCFGLSFHGSKPSKGAVGVPNRIHLDNLNEDFGQIFEIAEDSLEFFDKVWVDAKLKNQNTFRQHFSDKYHFAYAFVATKGEHGIEKQLRMLMRENEQMDWVLCFRASVRNELLQSAILPAFRDPSVQLRLNPWSWYGKLIRHLTKDSSANPQLQDAFAQIRRVGDSLFGEVTKKVEGEALSISFPDARLSFQFNADTKTDLYKSCVIYIDDGFKSLLTDKGAGIQSATIMGLFTYYTNEVNTTGSALLCVEEPELYLHPHARRVISDRLDQFTDDGRNQVIITTHGVEFIRTSKETFHLMLVRKSREEGSTAQTLEAKAFLQYLVNNNQNELFFADKVILCEGHDEHILRAAIDELFPFELDRQNVSIVAVEGKSQFGNVAEMLAKLNIQCFIFADFDFLLRDKQKPEDFPDASAQDSVMNLPDAFLKQKHLASNRVHLWREAFKNLRDELRRLNRQAFYEGKTAADFEHVGLQERLRKLRKKGLCLLDGEIEGLSKDHSWLPPSQKFNLGKVYDLRRRLSEGERMEDLFDLQPIKEFMEAVLVIPVVEPDQARNQ
jgi:predicted ATPase